MSLLFGTTVSLSKPSSRIGLFVVALLAAATPQLAFAQGMPSAASLFENFSDASIIMMDLVVGIAFIAGIFISLFGLLKFKEYSEAGGRMKLSTPLGIIAVGALLVIMPGIINTTTETLSLGANTGKTLLSVNPGGSEAVAAMAGAMKGILLFVKLIGHLAFFRGLLILKSLSEGAQGATIGRALTHIFGGAAAININATASLLAATFALPLPM